MTAQEKIEHGMLFPLTNKVKYVPSAIYKKATENIVGNGFYNIIIDLEKRGLLEQGNYYIEGKDYTEHGYQITNAGINYYNGLNEVERKDKRLYCIFVWTLIAAVIGAIAAILAIFL